MSATESALQRYQGKRWQDLAPRILEAKERTETADPEDVFQAGRYRLDNGDELARDVFADGEEFTYLLTPEGPLLLWHIAPTKAP